MNIQPPPEAKWPQIWPNDLESARELPVYPQNENEILQSWKTRLKIWEKQVNLVPFRPLSCCFTRGSIKIDQFTSLGESIFNPIFRVVRLTYSSQDVDF
jgi:hypothetical protein